jgi:hypothetical protein
VQQIAAVLVVAGLVVFVVGIVNKHCTCAGLPNLGETLNDVISDFYANVSVDSLSIANGCCEGSPLLFICFEFLDSF